MLYMIVTFKGKLGKHYENEKKLEQKYGNQAELIARRINQLLAAESLYDISKLPQAKLHPLSNNRKGQYAVSLLHPKRLILLPMDGDGTDLKSITSVQILEIVNYH